MSGEGRTRHGKGRGVGRDDVSIVPYGVHNKKSVGADDPARPFDIRRIFTKMSFRGAKRRGNPFPRVADVRCGGNTDVLVAVPKIFVLPYGGRLKF